MDATEALASTPPGSVTVIEGPSASGVSRSLAAVCDAAAASGVMTVLAGWERPPSGWEGVLVEPTVSVPFLVNWTLGDLVAYLDSEGVGEGAVLAIDHLGLISGDRERNLQAVNVLASDRALSLFVGVMTRSSADA